MIDKKIIAIMGMPRTGTTLMRQLLIASGKVCMPHDVPENFFSELAKSYWSSWNYSKNQRSKNAKDWLGDAAFNTDIKEVNPWMSNSNICTAADMGVITPYYRKITTHMLNSTNNDRLHVGIKNVRDTQTKMLEVVRFMSEMYGDKFKCIHTFRHPFYQIRSELNSTWSPIRDNDHAIEVFMMLLHQWDIHATCLHVLATENKDACIVNYEDRKKDYWQAINFTGLEWNKDMSNLMNGPKLNPSTIRFPLNETCFEDADSIYRTCMLVKEGHGSKRIDNFKSLVR